LDLLSNFDWANQPLIVNLNKELTTEIFNDLIHNFNSSRNNAQSSPCLYICSPQDRTSSHWTLHKPTPITLNRIISYAQNALKLSLRGYQELDFNFKVHFISFFFFFFYKIQSIIIYLFIFLQSIFLTPTSDYDVLIKLKQKACPKSRQGLNFDPKKQKVEAYKNFQVKETPLIDFDPVALYLKELEVNFFFFFHFDFWLFTSSLFVDFI